MLKEQEKKRIKYVAFQKIILDFQLKSHENFLINFIEKFRQVDSDQNGIVDEAEFRKLIKTIDPQSEMGIKVDLLLDILDPFSNDIITFSSIVTLLSSVGWPNPSK
jgi:Ca2+-binding EF-hand superfamily protein